MQVRRWVRRIAFAGAAVTAALPFVPSHASADSAANLSYNAKAEAYGVLQAADMSPSPSPVGNLFTQEVPAATSTFTAAGTTRADAFLAQPGNAGAALALACVALSSQSDPHVQQFCDNVSSVTSVTPFGSFPLAWPLQATATPDSNGKPQYPAFEEKVGGTTEFGGNGVPLDLFPGKAVATATDTKVTSDAAIDEANFFTDTPAVVKVGQVSTSTKQYVENGAIVSQATAVLHDITIAGQVEISELKSVATVINKGKGSKSITKKASTTLTGVTAGGQAAEITDKGISILGQGDNGALTDALNNQVLSNLKQAGIAVKLLKPTGAITGGNTASVDAGGLLVTWSHKVDIPNQLTDPYYQVLRQLQLTCIPPPNFPPPPNNPGCYFNAPSPNATYFGTFRLGAASVDNYAAPFASFNFGGGNFGGNVSGPTSRYIPGTPGSLGTPGSTGVLPQTTTTAPPTSAPSPTVAPQNQTFLSNILKDTSGRLADLFPAFFLVLLGVIAGRYPPYPAR